MTETSVRSATSDVLGGRYRTDSGPVLLTGVQAIARLLVEQHERDSRSGRRVATFVSGYQGSPLAGLDQLLAGLPQLRAEHDVRLVPALNEELAATSVWGSQLELPVGTRTHDGVIGIWYGKGPGLDRASDALRHAAMYGAHPLGGALALVGDDPAAKSSSVPAASERSLAALSMPIFFPRNATEIIAFGLYAVALSRASGCFPAIKLVADVADGLWTLDRDFSDLDITVPPLEWEGRPWTYRQRVLAAPPDSVLAEADLYGPRWDMVQAFNAANDIDQIEVDPDDAWLGIVAVGTAYDALREALTMLRLTETDLYDKGIRIMRVGMPYPLGTDKVRRLARNVEQVLVVEDKNGFVEGQVKEALFGAWAPAVIGKRALDGNRLIPADGELTAARLTAPLRKVLKDRIATPALPSSLQLTVLPTTRTPYFCSGCPHNRSTAVPAGSLAAGGIGCHTLVTMSSRTDSAVTGLTQMGGEGAQWIGQAPFTDIDHIFQNVGDGTYFHSGQLAVQACVAAGVNITYKILYNSAVAMTGAQEVEGALAVPALTHKLIADGTRRIIICADEPERYRGITFAPNTQLWHRDRLDEAQRILRDVNGVTVLIYDQRCAADARRKRKRGKLPARTKRVLINEAVCEGCGDCGVKSNCLSVQPVDTELGRKTQIDQTTCNTDYSCLDGNCPSFVTVDLSDDSTDPNRPDIPTPPEVHGPPLPAIGETFNIFLAGIGGTGVVTVNQILAMAALRSGLRVEGLDQTGLSQKAGPVTSHLRLSNQPLTSSNRVGPQSADCLLAFDLLTAVDVKNLGCASTERTAAVASTSKTPTGDMVYDPSITYPDTDDLLSRLDVCAQSLVAFDAVKAAQYLFHDTSASNILLVGAAYQAGALPISATLIEEAIQINGVAVPLNVAAFRWGRVAVADPTAFAAMTAKQPSASSPHPAAVDQLVSQSSLIGDPAELLKRRSADLIAYQGPRPARRLIDLVERTWRAERAVTDRTELSKAVTSNFFKLLAYKDEYEVARQLTDPAFTNSVAEQVPGARNITYRLHPPVLKALGVERKIGLGPRTHVALRVLAKGRFLRGHFLDPFGHTTMRRLERRLIDHYETMITALTEQLTTDNYQTTLAAAGAPDIVRGYEEVKLANVGRYIDALTALGIPTPDLLGYTTAVRSRAALWPRASRDRQVR